MFSASALPRSSPTRPVAFVAIGAGAAVLLAAVVAVAVFAWSPVRALSASFVPSVASGHIPDTALLDEVDLPAIARLDPGLLSAIKDAAAAAAAEGIVLELTSGWRSREYQQWLLEEAIATYGSEEIARRFVATPERSSHVTGEAVDVGGIDAQSWLIERGAQWGLCQIYANERWHFEIATDPGGVCPELLPDAAG